MFDAHQRYAQQLRTELLVGTGAAATNHVRPIASLFRTDELPQGVGREMYMEMHRHCSHPVERDTVVSSYLLHRYVFV